MAEFKDNLSDFDFPNFAAQHEARLSALRNRPLETWDDRRIKDSGVFCEHCKEEITDDHYFQCEYHQTVFCDRCVKNDYLSEKQSRDCANCTPIDIVRSGNHNRDCIFKRKDIDEQPKKKRRRTYINKDGVETEL